MMKTMTCTRVFPRLRPRTAAPSCKECGTCENRSTTKFWHREVLALSSSPSYLKNQTSLREGFPKERGGLRSNVISRCSPKTPSTPHLCQMYVRCMSNVRLSCAVACALPRAQIVVRVSLLRPCPLNGSNKTRIGPVRRSSSSLRRF